MTRALLMMDAIGQGGVYLANLLQKGYTEYAMLRRSSLIGRALVNYLGWSPSQLALRCYLYSGDEIEATSSVGLPGMEEVPVPPGFHSEGNGKTTTLPQKEESPSSPASLSGNRALYSIGQL